MSDNKVPDIHISCWSGHNAIQLLCDKSWITAKWGTEEEKYFNENVYWSDDDRLYTFEIEQTTCPQCLSHLQKS